MANYLFRRTVVHRKLLLAAMISIAAASTYAAEIMSRTNPLAVAWLSVPDSTKALMRSGFDFEDGNMDSGNIIRIEPGDASFTNAEASWVLFEAEGPGVLTSIWLTGKSKQGAAWLGGRMNFFFDAELAPRFTGKLPDLFEGNAAPGVFRAPLTEKSSGGWVSYAPLHFSKSLKITVSDHGDGFGHRKNARGTVIPHIYHQFTWQRLKSGITSTPADASALKFQRDTPGVEQRRSIDFTAGEQRVVFLGSGQGILRGLRLRWDSLNPDLTSIRIVADGKATVDLSIPELMGFSRTSRPAARFESMLLGAVQTHLVASQPNAPTSETYYCYFPMPHRERLEIQLLNRGPAGRVTVDTTHERDWPSPEHFYFHAARVEDKTERGRDLTLLNVTGRGHYVGVILQMPDGTLEGDDRFFVDDEPFPPSWHGTGTEDYFRCGWYFNGGALTRPLYGLLDDARPKLAYRFHMADRVNFTRSLRINFEHGHGNKFIGPVSGVVFWYGER